MKTDKDKKIIEKNYYEVRVETMLPATLIYRVLAEGPEEAADLIKNQAPVGIKHRLIGKKDLHLKVYNSGGSVIQFMRKFFGV